jgi:hypothetical protein
MGSEALGFKIRQKLAMFTFRRLNCSYGVRKELQGPRRRDVRDLMPCHRANRADDETDERKQAEVEILHKVKGNMVMGCMACSCSRLRQLECEACTLPHGLLRYGPVFSKC